MSERSKVRSLGYRKRFYKVGEVRALTGLESHVLRYWEAEFPALKPRKSRGGQRLYRPQDIELLLQIKDLLYSQGYTIAGARRRLQAGDDESLAAPEELIDVVDQVRHEIRAILTMLEANDTL